MARRSNREDPLSAVRRLLRELRAPSPAIEPRRRAAMLGAVEIALFRLPSRQREIVRRYDLGGERARDLQSSLALSPRQFFRDHRQALAVLSECLFDEAMRARPSGSSVVTVARIAVGSDPAMAGRTYARSLAQSGSARCLEVFERMASTVAGPLERTDLLLELAETATDYSDDGIAAAAIAAAQQALDVADFRPAISDWLHGRLAGAQAHLSQTAWGSVEHFERSISFLRRSIALEPALAEPRASLAGALGNAALLLFTIGSFAQSRAAAAEAVEVIQRFGLSNRPKALETLAMYPTIEAVLSGRTRAAVSEVVALLAAAGEAGWSSTASWLGAVIVGLTAVGGDYGEAIRWYRTMAPLALTGARPRDRSGLTMEAAHAYTMIGQPAEALSILGYVRPGNGCPRAEVPGWHLFTAAALHRLGDDRAALGESNQALAGLAGQGPGRGLADAHRWIATCQSKLGNARAAREHLTEARRLCEHHGTPYQLLRTLSAEAAILPSPARKREAVEYASLLRSLARS